MSLHNLRPYRRPALALLLVMLAIIVPHYATAEIGGAQPAAAPVPAGAQPILAIVPGDDGLSVTVRASGVDGSGLAVFSSMRIGPTGNKGSYTMQRPGAAPDYVVSVPGFSAAQAITGTVAISTSVGFTGGDLEFVRGYVPSDTPAVTVATGQAELRLANANSFSSAAYLVVAPSYAPPGPPPAGMQIIGSSYSLAASGARLTSAKPMSLRISFAPAELGGADPQSLAIYAWDQAGGSWQRLGGSLFLAQGYVSVATDKLSSYALMAKMPYAAYLPLALR